MCNHNIKPLSFSLFTQHILVPHVATQLIAEDKGCSVDEAFKIMCDSGDYGYRQFPDTDDDPDYDGVQQTCMRLAKECT